MTATAALAGAASAVFLARLLPQPLRTLRTGEVAGVSALAAVNAMLADVAWFVYGVSAGRFAVWAVSVPAAAASAWTLFLLRRSLTARAGAAAAGWAAVIAAGAATGHLGPVLAVTVLVTCAPALWSAWTSPTAAGLTPWTWWLAVADAGTWGAYGVALGDRALELYGAVLMATALAVLIRLAGVARSSGSGDALLEA